MGSVDAINVLFHFADILFDPAILSLLKKTTIPTATTSSYYNNANSAYSTYYNTYYNYNNNSAYSTTVSTVAFDNLNDLIQMVAQSPIVVAHLVQTSKLTALANQISFYTKYIKDLGMFRKPNKNVKILTMI